jgi:acyl-coenzyme A thioesterase PaaI-like protein
VKMEIRFRHPCPTGQPFHVEASILQRKGRFATAQAIARLDDETLVAEATGTFSVS